MKLKHQERQFLSRALTIIKKGVLLAIPSFRRASTSIKNTRVYQQGDGSAKAPSPRRPNGERGFAIGGDNDRLRERTPNDDRSDSLNPNNPAYKDVADNRSNQMNPSNPTYHSSRGGGRRK